MLLLEQNRFQMPHSPTNLYQLPPFSSPSYTTPFQFYIILLTSPSTHQYTHFNILHTSSPSTPNIPPSTSLIYFPHTYHPNISPSPSHTHNYPNFPSPFSLPPPPHLISTLFPPPTTFSHFPPTLIPHPPSPLTLYTHTKPPPPNNNNLSHPTHSILPIQSNHLPPPPPHQSIK